jgi:putative glutamine amidotransferase
MAMPRAPVIGLTTYAPRSDGRYTLPAEYVECVRRAGGLPWLLPPGEPRWREFLARVDALILTGGGDIDPARYGGADHPKIYAVDRQRDELEFDLTRASVESGTPLLGICRGCQVVNVALGGTLIEHLPDVVGEVVTHRGAGPGTSSLHPVEVAAGSSLERILGERCPSPSSSHHQAIRDVAAGFEVVARAADGTIEAIERRDHPFFLAVQWHPEETAEQEPAQQRLFDALVQAARTRPAR